MFKEIPANKQSILQRKPVFNIGTNDSNYIVQQTINGKRVACPYYRAWKNMLQRCYSVEYHKIQPTYSKCSVATEWLLFSNYKQWMKTQDWKGKQLDKDILVPGNKVYSPDTCCFVTSQLNRLLVDRKAKRGPYPQGVSYSKSSKKFQSRCNLNGKLKNLGYFDTSEEARLVYNKFKSNLIIETANLQTNIRIKNGLLKQVELL